MSSSKKSKERTKSKRRLVFDDDEDDDDDKAKDATSHESKAKRQSSHPTKRPRPSVSSPAKKSKKALVVTPDVKKVAAKEDDEYVPLYIYKNVEYRRKNQTDLDETTLNAFDLVTQHFEIPKDLERRSFGPLSGSCYEQRVLQAYTLGQLEPKNDEIEICTACATVGHVRDECPELI